MLRLSFCARLPRRVTQRRSSSWATSISPPQTSRRTTRGLGFSKQESRAIQMRFITLPCLGGSFDFGPPEDDARRALLVRAAELGSADAQRDLGSLYATGDDGFPKDEALGRLWYGRAAAQGHADAQYNYGSMLLYGEGGPPDPEEAKALIRKAAAQGDPCALHFAENCPDELA